MKRFAIVLVALATAGCSPRSRPVPPAGSRPSRVDVTRGLPDIREEAGQRWSTFGNVSVTQLANGGWSISRDRSDHARTDAGNAQLMNACHNAFPDWPEAVEAVTGIWAYLHRQPPVADRALSFPRCGYRLTFTVDELTEELTAVPRIED